MVTLLLVLALVAFVLAAIVAYTPSRPGSSGHWRGTLIPLGLTLWVLAELIARGGIHIRIGG